MYKLYIGIYIFNRITVLISFSVSLALYNRYARGEGYTSCAYIYIYIFSRNYSILFFYSSPINPSPSVIDTSPSPLCFAHPDTEIQLLSSLHYSARQATHTHTLVVSHSPSPSNPLPFPLVKMMSSAVR